MWLAQQAEKKERETREAQDRLAAERAAWEAERKPPVVEEALEGVEQDESIQRLVSSYGDDTRDKIALVCNELRDFLISKNEQYGNSAIEPVRIFSRASSIEQLYVRIDDKLSRLARGNDRLETDDDVVNDLIGYLILLKVARRRDDA